MTRFLPRPRTISLIAALIALTGAGCKMGPDYRRPDVPTANDWRWKEATPNDHVPKGEWWRIFNDPVLNAMQQEAAAFNQDLRAAAARVDEARAIARMDRSALFPSISGSPAFNRYRTSGNAPNPFGFPAPSFTISEWQVPFDLSYEVDLWGRVRRAFESARFEAAASQAAFQNVLLTLQADVAANYFALVGARAEIATLERAIELREEALKLFQQRLDAGIGTEFEVERTKVEVATARADLAAARQSEAELINALAVLCGRSPASFELPDIGNRLVEPPAIAPGLPSALLERRPDVAEAERELAARNAEIGVAQGAFFPAIRLTAAGGFQSGDLSDLFRWDSRVWSLGPSVSFPIFQGGRLRADLDRARAVYEEAIANYRQRILVAFREVDDSLAAIRFLKDQLDAREAAVIAAQNSAKIAFERFSAGTVNFLEVVDAESAQLQNELARVRIATQQLTATVRLIKALGGGWDEGPARIEPGIVRTQANGADAAN